MKRDTIIIVDDMEINRAILRGVFEKDYNLLEAENGNQALLLVEQYHAKIAAMLLDLVMPVKDGYQVMTEIGNKNRLAEFPVVVITAEDSAESEVQAFDLGASDIIMKPFEPHVVKRRVQNIIELNLHKLNQEELIEEQAAKLRESNAVMVDALSSIIEYRSVETGQHVKRIRMFTQILLEDVARSYPEFGLTEQKIGIIVSASSMHDIGKIAIPDSILNKPGRLTAEEFEIMKTHTIKGCELLASLDRMSDREYLQYAYNICRYHHERWDGKGYPDKLKGESIPVCAQVVGIADCYDALTTDRVYKKALAPEVAFNMILNGECGSFSPKLLECFKNVRVTFANLSKEYADNNLQKNDTLKSSSTENPKINDTLDTLQLGQMKYFTLLRYMDSTVMEVDLNTDLYHVVYLSNKDFEPLKTGSRFSESIRNFTENAVHPDDQTVMLQFLDGDMAKFFEAGYMKKMKKCRVYNRRQKEYCWCEVTVMRIDTGYPHQRKAVLIWKELDEDLMQAAEIVPFTYNDSILQGLLGGVHQCLNDQGFTLIQVNEGFTDLLGYSEQEIREKFNNQYMNFVYPADRQELVRQLKEQLKSGNSIETEYRVTAKDGRILWLLDKGRLVTGSDGEEYFICALIDITQSKKAQEELRLMLERHKIIMEQTNDIIFEWDIMKDAVSYSSNWEKKFGYEPIKDMASSRIPEVSHIHPEELPNIIQLIRDMAAGVPYEECELRIADINGRYRWCKIRAACQFNGQGKPFKAVGVIADIDEEKRVSQALREKAERDELTRLYNKSTAQRLIDSYLEQKRAGERAAFLIIDVDDFKKLNDRFGHLFGDSILQKIASELHRLFRNDDVVARIGGDEFLIFMKNIADEESVISRIKKIIDAFERMFNQNTMVECQISCSIGIAFSPRDGEHFDVLFQRSDIALYEAKSQGKNCYMVYDQETMNRPFGVLEPQIVANTRIDSDDASGLVSNVLVNQAFKKLYEADHMEQAVNSILEMVGRQFSVSRAYIFEDSEDGRYTSNTFEWCNDGIIPQKDKLQNICYEDIGAEYKTKFDENGIFYCHDIEMLPKETYDVLAPQGIKSMLQCEIRDEGRFCGFVGFDNCIIRRTWMKEQINALMFTSKLISAFLLKKRAKDRAVNLAEDMKEALDHQNAWIYVIDSENYQLLYINAKAAALTPRVGIGMCCYDVLNNCGDPCEDCVVKKLKSDSAGEAIEVYNSVLKVWASVSVSGIQWEGKKAFLVTCQDITPYKQGEAGGK